MSDVRLSISNLSIRFNGNAGEFAAVDGISLSIAPHRMLALVGESGSGKTLTALSVLRLLPEAAHLSADSIQLDGEELIDLPEQRMRGIRGGKVGMIFQEPLSSLNPLHTVEKQISEAIFTHQGLSRTAARRRCLDLLEKVRLPDAQAMLKRYPHQLSGGQRQRVMIAMALANDPVLLIADEPTTALDVTIQEEILDLLKQLQRDLGLSVLLITHDLGIVRRYAEDVAVMHNGRLVEVGTTRDVTAAPRAEYTQHLLASEPHGSVAASETSTPLLEARNLRVWFPIRKGLLRRRVDWFRALDDINLDIPAGQTLGVVGESGSGKTTLGMALLRLLESRGRITFDNTRLDQLRGNRALKPWRRQLQVVFQDPWGTLNPRMTVGEIIAEGLKVHERLDGVATEERVTAMLREVNLPPEARHRYPHEFSGGQRQRIAIARSLILNPRLLVLDEPTSALDRSVQQQILTLLKELQDRHGLSYLFISHDLKLVRSISHQLVVLNQGRIVEAGPTETVFQQPREAYTRRLMHAAFDETVKY